MNTYKYTFFRYFRPGKDSGANKWIMHLLGGGWYFNLFAANFIKGIEDF